MSVKIKVVIFDLDGTLADTIEANAIAYTEAFREYGIDLSPEDHYSYYGKKWNEWGPELAGRYADAIHKRKIELYQDMLEYIKPIPETISQWQKFKDRCILVLATNASPECARKVLDKLRLSFDYEFYGKDYPNSVTMLKDILSSLNVDPCEVLLIDDDTEKLKIAKSLNIQIRSVNRKIKR